MNMIDVIHLTDYHGQFGSKYNDVPYRSGLDLRLLENEYEKLGINPIFVPFAQIKSINEEYSNCYIAYTSAEDSGYLYKKFIEDIVLSLELSGAIMLPKYIFLRATNNKVFMEKLRELFFPEQAALFKTLTFGCADELFRHGTNNVKYPVIVKTAEGSSGKGVFLAYNKDELLRIVKEVSRSKNLRQEIWNIGRSLRYKGYKRESLFRKRFILQNFIPGLKNDWKIYVFGSKYYIFFRPILKHRKFKASGGGYHNYSYGEKAQFPPGIFDFAKMVYEKLNVPHLSLDVAFDGQKFYLLEFQCLYFGTAGIVKSACYYTFENNDNWQPRYEKLSIEAVYASSIKEYILKEQGK